MALKDVKSLFDKMKIYKKRLYDTEENSLLLVRR